MSSSSSSPRPPSTQARRRSTSQASVDSRKLDGSTRSARDVDLLSSENDAEPLEDDIIYGDSEDSDPPVYDRPNKYEGPRSTWIDWTANEREVAKSLDQLEADDLSLHLYNAHWMHMRAQQAREVVKGQKGRRSRSQQDAEWEPFLYWTAWPLSKHDVSREGEGRLEIYDGVPTIRKPGPEPSSRQVLEELLTAEASTQARQRLVEDLVDISVENAEDSEAEVSVTDESTENLRSPGHMNEDIESTRAEPTDIDALAESEDLGDPEETEPKKAARQIPNEQSTGSDDSESIEGKYDGSSDGDIEFLDDDDQIAAILQRPVRHLLTEIDSLLAALHHSRASYVDLDRISEPDSDNENRPDTNDRSLEASDESEQSTDDPDSSDHPRQSSKNLKRARSPGSIRGRASKQRATSKSKDTRSVARSKSTARTTSRSRSGERPPLYGLRGWDDVLGFASLAGWDPHVVQRARHRCQEMFGERMDDWWMLPGQMREQSEEEADESGVTTSEEDADDLAEEDDEASEEDDEDATMDEHGQAAKEDEGLFVEDDEEVTGEDDSL